MVEPRDPAFAVRVRASFERQRLMATIGARLVRVSPGEVDIEAPFGEGLTQQHGYLHAGIVTALVDSACGYSALSLAPPDSEVLSVEYKVNFLAPAQGERFVARGRVVRSGQKINRVLRRGRCANRIAREAGRRHAGHDDRGLSYRPGTRIP